MNYASERGGKMLGDLRRALVRWVPVLASRSYCNWQCSLQTAARTLKSSARKSGGLVHEKYDVLLGIESLHCGGERGRYGVASGIRFWKRSRAYDAANDSRLHRLQAPHKTTANTSGLN